MLLSIPAVLTIIYLMTKENYKELVWQEFVEQYLQTGNVSIKSIMLFIPPLCEWAFRFALVHPSKKKFCDKDGKVGTSVSSGHIFRF